MRYKLIRHRTTGAIYAAEIASSGEVLRGADLEAGEASDPEFLWSLLESVSQADAYAVANWLNAKLASDECCILQGSKAKGASKLASAFSTIIGVALVLGLLGGAYTAINSVHVDSSPTVQQGLDALKWNCDQNHNIYSCADYLQQKHEYEQQRRNSPSFQKEQDQLNRECAQGYLNSCTKYFKNHQAN